jgi:serine/threonine protein phosphatase PrpC
MTDAGKKGRANEDALLRLPDGGLFCVADGMGGGSYGGEASQIIVKSLAGRMAPPAPGATLEDTAQLVSRVLNEASYRIKDMAEERGVSSIGSTVVILALDLNSSGQAVILHAGDSRAYRLRKGVLERLTVDHSIASALGVSNEGSLPAMLRGVITNAVGIKPTVELEKDPVQVRQGDLFLLCSDGLTRGVPDDTIRGLLMSEPGANLEGRAQRLIDVANEAGGEDNISVILVQIDACPSAPEEVEDGEPLTDMTSRSPLSSSGDEARTHTTRSAVKMEKRKTDTPG